jgi:riboflavin transporter FmnP
MEFIAVAVGLAVTALLWRRDKALAAYGAAVMLAAATSGASLGMLRYVLGVPALFLVPASLSRFALFDRLWTLASILGLALLAITFSFGFWTG